MPVRPSSRAREKTARDHLPRLPLAREVQRRIETLGLTRVQAARIVRDADSQLSRLMSGHVHDFSADRLVGMLVSLGVDVEVVIRHPRPPKRHGKVSIRALH